MNLIKFIIATGDKIPETEVQGICNVTYAISPQYGFVVYKGLKEEFCDPNVAPGDVYSVHAIPGSERTLRRERGHGPKIQVAKLGIPERKNDLWLWLFGFNNLARVTVESAELAKESLKDYQQKHDEIPPSAYRTIELVEDGSVRYLLVICHPPNNKKAWGLAYAADNLTNNEIVMMLNATGLKCRYPRALVEHILKTRVGFTNEDLEALEEKLFVNE